METPITFMPLLISSLFLALVSFIKTSRKKKIRYTILISITWIAALLWTLNKFRVINF